VSHPATLDQTNVGTVSWVIYVAADKNELLVAPAVPPQGDGAGHTAPDLQLMSLTASSPPDEDDDVTFEAV
jgi:hypothetical protein